VRPAAPPTATTDLQSAAAMVPARAPTAAPLVPVAATAAAPTASPPATPKPASLDALFAQVAGDR